MRITAAANVLLRAAVMDDPVQGSIAAEALLEADIVAVTLPSLCEFVWVLARGYKKGAGEVANAVRKLVESANVLVDRPAVEAGLAVLEGGGDFADGIIAFEGRRAEASSSRPSTPRRRRWFGRRAGRRGCSARGKRTSRALSPFFPSAGGLAAAGLNAIRIIYQTPS